MEPDDAVAEEETIMLTRRVRRRQRADAVAEPDDGLDESTRLIDDRTIVVERRRRGDAAGGDLTSDVPGSGDGDDLDERTVVVDRRRRADDVAAAGVGRDVPGAADGDALDERTVVVERHRADAVSAASDVPGPGDGDDLDERTVVVDRRGSAGASGLAQGGEGVDLDDRTIVADRRRRTGPADEAGADDEGLYDTVRRPPAAEVEKTPAIYKPRAAPRTPHRPPAFPGDVEPTRVIDPGVMSVTKDGRRRGLYAVVAVAGACVVSVIGLVLLGLLLIF